MMIDAGEDKSTKQTKRTTINLSHENRQWIDGVKDYIPMTRMRKRANENENKNGNKNVSDTLNEDMNEGMYCNTDTMLAADINTVSYPVTPPEQWTLGYCEFWNILVFFFFFFFF